MYRPNFIHRAAVAFAIATLVAATPTRPAMAQAAIDADATQVLSAMQDYLGSLKAFSMSYDADVDVLASTGQKLKFVSSGTVAVERSGKMHGTRKGSIAEIDLIVDGEKLTIFGRRANKYFQQPVSTIDEAIHFVRDEIGYVAPGADFLTEKPLEMEATDIVSGAHIGMTTIGGVPVHHLAFRGDKVDWQLWVQDGDKPLPVQYVITSKWQTGAPEYSLYFSDWNVEPSFDAAMFTFTPPADAQAVSTLSLNDVGEIVHTEE